MKNQWYADRRDLVKWGTLLHLAAAHDIRSIIQIAFLTPDDVPVRLTSELGDTALGTALDPRVLHHFRDISRIAELSGPNGPSICAFTQPFAVRSRHAYIRAALLAVQAVAERPVAVLLDPDTGIKERLATSKHVKDTEVSEFWSVLQPSDWLVLYQHAARQCNWLASRRAVFANALAGAPVHTFRALSGARDVAFFAAMRGHPA